MSDEKTSCHDDEKHDTKPHLTPQQSFHEMHGVDKPWGRVVVERNKNSQTFENIVKNSLIGTGEVLQMGAIVNPQGYILARYPEDFVPSMEQIKLVADASVNLGLLAVNGICLCDRNFTYTRSEQSGAGRQCACNLHGSCSSEEGKGGCVIVSTKQYLMIGLYFAKPENCGTKLDQQRGEATDRVISLAEWMSDIGM